MSITPSITNEHHSDPGVMLISDARSDARSENSENVWLECIHEIVNIITVLSILSISQDPFLFRSWSDAH